MRVSYENNLYEVSVDEKTNKISQIKIRRNNPTIMNIVKVLAILTASLFILDFFMDIGENLVSGVSSAMSSSSVSSPTVQTGGAGVSFIRSVGKYLLAILTIGLYFFSYEWSILSNDEQDKLINIKCFNDRVFSSTASPSASSSTVVKPATETKISTDTKPSTESKSSTETKPSVDIKPTGQTATTTSTVPSATTSQSAPAPVNADANSKVEKFTNYYGSSLSYAPFE